MSDWGQGFPRDPPGMVPAPHLPGGEDRVVEERHRAEGFWSSIESLYPQPPTQAGPGPLWG